MPFHTTVCCHQLPVAVNSYQTAGTSYRAAGMSIRRAGMGFGHDGMSYRRAVGQLSVSWHTGALTSAASFKGIFGTKHPGIIRAGP